MTTVPILLYHSISRDPIQWIRPFTVTPETFRRHLDVVAESGATPLTVSAFVAAVAGGATLPPRPVLITFDDGFADFYDEALPALLERNIDSTLYVTTGFVSARAGAEESRGAQMLDWEQLAKVSAAGVEIGAHGHSHAQLDAIPTSRAAAEISHCRSLLEDRLQGEITSFAYPHGYSSPRVRRLVRQAGYRSACGVKNTFSSTRDDRFALARLMLRSDTPLARVDAWLAGKGAPVARPGESARTRLWRVYRRAGVTLHLRPPVDLER
jgi:peptidoglycan/xylan/chitin deacetylase (PgdA/CDA1 family)